MPTLESSHHQTSPSHVAVTDDILFTSVHQIVQENDMESGSEEEEISKSIDLVITDSENDEEVFSERQSDVEFLDDIDHSDSELSFHRQIDNYSG